MIDFLGEWVSTAGGPLIILPSEIAHYWRGINPPPGIQVPPGWEWGDPDGTTCDYDRACAVVDDLGTLDVGPGRALVLGGEPMSTAFSPLPEGGLLVRWVAANGMEEVLRAVRGVPADLWRPTDHELRVDRGPLLMFDSACAGDGLTDERRKIEDYIDAKSMKIIMSPDRYSVDTADFRPDDHTWLILHRLRKASHVGLGPPRSRPSPDL